MKLATQPAKELMQWACERIGLAEMADPYRTLAWLDKNNKPKVVVIYNGFSADQSGYSDCQMHVAAQPGALWCTREFLNHAFAYPFEQMQCKRVTGLVRDDNQAALKLNKKLGFVVEGRIRQGQDGHDLILMGMLADECKWLKAIAKQPVTMR